MLPFTIDLRPGTPIHDQVVFAVKRAILTGVARPGDPFPSIRNLGRELGINPNTAQRIVSSLTSEGFLDIRPGIGSVVADGSRVDPEQGERLLGPDLEKLVVEAKRLKIEWSLFIEAAELHWRRIGAAIEEESDGDGDGDGDDDS